MPAVKRPYNIARSDTRQTDVIDATGVTSLAVSSNERDLSFLQSLFNDNDWKLHQAHTFREAMLELTREPIAVVICECQLPDGNWKDVLSQTAPMPERPRLIVISIHADEQLWSEVLAMGGFDLLATPLQQPEVAYVVGSAWLDWRNEHESAKKHASLTFTG